MPRPQAYHVVVRALESRSGWTPTARFAAAVESSTHGHLPYARYHAAGVARERAGAGEGVVERLVGDWLATDLNPVTQIIGNLTQTANARWALNAYSHSAVLCVRGNTASRRPADSDTRRFDVSRDLLATVDDPALCHLGVVSTMEALVGKVARNAVSAAAPEPIGLSSIAQYLGLDVSAATDVAVVFESEGQISIARAAQLLGCHQRTLERRLREEGVTAELLRRATRLVRATSQLRSSTSLTTIAIAEGFSDLAHMSRAFKAACGMSPSLLRQAALGGAVTEPRERIAQAPPG